MTEYFIGGIGKDYSYMLISEHPYVLYQRDAEPNFTAYPDIKTILGFISTNNDQTVYAFSSFSGNWEEVHFATAGLGAVKNTIGFQP